MATCYQCNFRTIVCRKCDGSGRGIFTECSYCAGTGQQCPEHEEKWR